MLDDGSDALAHVSIAQRREESARFVPYNPKGRVCRQLHFQHLRRGFAGGHIRGNAGRGRLCPQARIFQPPPHFIGAAHLVLARNGLYVCLGDVVGRQRVLGGLRLRLMVLAQTLAQWVDVVQCRLQRGRLARAWFVNE